MEENIDNVLKNLLKEYGRDVNQADPIIKTLHENWFFKLKDIKDLDAQSWKDLGLPVNLFNLLSKKVKEAVETPTQLKPQIQQTSNQEKSQIEQKSFENAISKMMIEKEKFNAYKDMLTNKNTQVKEDIDKKQTKQMIEEEEVDNIKIYVTKYLENIIGEIRDTTVYVPILKNLYKVIENIIKNPSDPKYKRVKAQGGFIENSVTVHESVLRFFTWIPFLLSEENETKYYIFKGSMDDLHKIYKYYTEFLLSKKIVKLNFDAYSTHVTSLGTAAEQIKSKVEMVDYDELIKKEQARRDSIIKNSKTTERNTKIFIIDNNKIGELLNKLNEEIEKNSLNQEEEESKKSALKLLKENKEKEKFKLRLRTEYEKLISSNVYEIATVRIKFPDLILVQANFAQMETIGDIYNFIKEILINPNEPFYIFTTPPVKKFEKLKLTIFNEKLAPCTTMYIGFPNIDPKEENIHYISKEAFDKYYTEFQLN